MSFCSMIFFAVLMIAPIAAVAVLQHVKHHQKFVTVKKIKKFN